MSTAPTELIIEAGHTERNYWRDLFRYRELFYFLAWRDVLVRYKQTVIESGGKARYRCVSNPQNQGTDHRRISCISTRKLRGCG